MVCTRVLSAVSVDTTLGGDGEDAAMVVLDVAVVFGRSDCDDGSGDGDGDDNGDEEDVERDDADGIGVVGVIFMRMGLDMQRLNRRERRTTRRVCVARVHRKGVELATCGLCHNDGQPVTTWNAAVAMVGSGSRRHDGMSCASGKRRHIGRREV